ncbi:hypothetical protein AB0J90_18350 [Micromonospora sp. NPDC049523]|uniref:RHS repeat domain-containing protein n=1 Tax=Micromonospora sp. NPDC049523 TaxID=3155921 RepID=UPI0034278F76
MAAPPRSSSTTTASHTVTDPVGAATSYEYDSAGRLESTTDALNGATLVDYDAVGRVLKVTDARGFVLGDTLCDETRTAIGCATTGAAAGAVAGLTGGLAASTGAGTLAVGALSGLTGDATEQILSTGTIDTQRLASATLAGGALGWAGGKLLSRLGASPVSKPALATPPKSLAILPRHYEFDMVTNPGPLASLRGAPAGNFAGGRYNATSLTADTIFYRAGKAGGGPNGLGQWFTTTPPNSVAHARIDTAVRAQWFDPGTGGFTGASPLESAYAVSIPKETTVYSGPTGSQGESSWAVSSRRSFRSPGKSAELRSYGRGPIVTQESSRTEVREALRRLHDLVYPEGHEASRWVQLIRAAQAVAASPDVLDLDALQEVRSIYRSMYGGGRNFSDFFLWREDFQDRLIANEELKSAKDELERVLDIN